MRLPCSDFNVFRQLSSSLAGRVVVMPFLKRLGPLLAFQRGMLVACCRKTLIPLALRVTTSGIEVQVLKPHAKAEGVCAASSHRRGDGWTDGPAVCWALLEDGSTQCYMCGHMEDSEAAFSAALGRAYAKQPSSRAPSFPVDFFERSTCVTANPEITLGGDVTHNSTAANAKARRKGASLGAAIQSAVEAHDDLAAQRAREVAKAALPSYFTKIIGPYELRVYWFEICARSAWPRPPCAHSASLL